MSSSGWVGVDLDGTLAKYEGFVAPDEIGEPIPLMLGRVKRWLAGGADVRIFTARVYWHEGDEADWHKTKEAADLARAAIEKWCLKHLGKVLPITCTKDYHMHQLWDDRAVQIIPNTGRRADGGQ